VRIDGRPAAVDSVEWVSDGSPAVRDTPSLEVRKIEANRKANQDGRWMVFLYQKHTDLSDVEGVMRLRRDFAVFSKIVAAGDHVAILSFDTRLRLWLDFTNDVERIRRVIEHDILVGSPPPIPASAAPSVAAVLSREVMDATYTIEESLRLLGDLLNPLPGAKSIIVLGFGMGTWIPAFGVVQMDNDYTETVYSLLEARVSVFCVDVTKADYHPREEGLRIVADQTGGLYLNSHIFTAAVFDRIAGALAGYYVLLVAPPDGPKGERHVEITLPRQRGTVMGKHAYLAR
jgi:hypothetical protein